MQQNMSMWNACMHNMYVIGCNDDDASIEGSNGNSHLHILSRSNEKYPHTVNDQAVHHKNHSAALNCCLVSTALLVSFDTSYRIWTKWKQHL